MIVNGCRYLHERHVVVILFVVGLKDATYTNIWQKKYLARVAKLQEERKFNPAKVGSLKTSIAQIERDIATLAKWEGKASAAPLS